MTPCSALSGTRRHIPEEDTLQNHRCENLKSYMKIFPLDPDIYLFKTAARTSSKTTSTIIKPSRLVLFREIVAANCENLTEPIGALCGQNAEFLNVIAGVIYRGYFDLKS
jgi:hypothetical protein